MEVDLCLSSFWKGTEMTGRAHTQRGDLLDGFPTGCGLGSQRQLPYTCEADILRIVAQSTRLDAFVVSAWY